METLLGLGMGVVLVMLIVGIAIYVLSLIPIIAVVKFIML